MLGRERMAQPAPDPALERFRQGSKHAGLRGPRNIGAHSPDVEPPDAPPALLQPVEMTRQNPTKPGAPALVLGLDGATFDVIRPLAEKGELPNLARWMGAGLAKPLASTTPPVTFPAWSSFLTGLGPGEHGLFDFTQKVAGSYRLRFTNASHRRGASFFHTVSEAGGRVLALGMPATYPPEPLNGLLVSGFDFRFPEIRAALASEASCEKNARRQGACHIRQVWG